MEEKWMVRAKRANFQQVAQEFGVDPVVARLMRNREVYTEEDQTTDGGRPAKEKIQQYLYGGIEQLHDPRQMKHLDLAAELVAEAIRTGKRIRVIGDYDIDGVTSSYLLLDGLTRCGAEVDVRIPERIRDGYGLNENLVKQASEDGRELLLTCDNGIAAAQEIALAKELGLQVVVTDHHQVPVKEGEPMLPPADAVVDPHQEGETYPYHGLCGAGVAYKLLWRLFDLVELPDREQWKRTYLQYVAMATVGDVMELTGENRILVREGLKELHHTENPGLLELIRQNQLEASQIDVYHIGFVLGPCLNASGRLDTAQHALELLMAKDREQAAAIAGDLITLNAGRKELTLAGTEQAVELVASTDLCADRVLVVFLPKCHESLAGIIAGRLRERYHKPAFVLTRTEDGVKGSGRSIEAYSMYEELCKCADLLRKFGGHPMAAGISLAEEDVDAFRRRLNENCTLTDEDLIEKVMIDVPMPIGYVSEHLIEQLDVLKPFGNGNPKPVFAQSGLHVRNARVFGAKRNVCKLRLEDGNGQSIDAVYFGEADAFCTYAKQHESIAVIYYPTINTWQGRNNLQAVISSYH